MPAQPLARPATTSAATPGAKVAIACRTAESHPGSPPSDTTAAHGSHARTKATRKNGSKGNPGTPCRPSVSRNKDVLPGVSARNIAKLASQGDLRLQG
jgi:hypothetical protein